MAGERVLVIDDDPDIKDLLFDALRLVNYDVYEARNGEEGLRAAKRYPPDVVLLDIGLPLMNGFEVVRALRNQVETRDTPIIFITSYDQQTVETRGAEVDADYYALKPFDPQDLVADLYAFLSRQAGDAGGAFRVMRRIPARRPGRGGVAGPARRPAAAQSWKERPVASPTPGPGSPAETTPQQPVLKDDIEELRSVLRDLRSAIGTLSYIAERLVTVISRIGNRPS